MSEETKSVTPTVEEALAELREMFPDADSLQVSVDAWCWKERGGGDAKRCHDPDRMQPRRS